MGKSNYQWELINSEVLMVPEEKVAYHIYKYIYFTKINQSKKAEREKNVVVSLMKERNKESEEVKCLMK